MVEVEKKKNLDLLNRIAELEARCQAKQQDAEEKKSSNLEQLLQKTLSRVTELENQVKSVGEKPPEPKPVEKVVPTPAPASEAEEPDESCDEGAESDDEGITTPSGQNAPLTSYSFSTSADQTIWFCCMVSDFTFSLRGPGESVLKLKVKISTDALRMRTRRLCEKRSPVGAVLWILPWPNSTKKGEKLGKSWRWHCWSVWQSTASAGMPIRRLRQAYMHALLVPSIMHVEFLLFCDMHRILCARNGPVQSDFQQKCKLIRERLESRECETHGKWMTEEAMKRSGLFSASAMKHIIAYCKRFPESLVRL